MVDERLLTGSDTDSTEKKERKLARLPGLLSSLVRAAYVLLISKNLLLSSMILTENN